MSERDSELRRFYDESRIRDQLAFYNGRLEQFDRAAGQGLFISATVLGFASAAGALAGTALGWAHGWAALAAILAAVSTAMAAYLALYAFDLQSKIYGDAVRAVRAASRPLPHDSWHPEESVADVVKRVERALRQEQSQWGQLTSRIQAGD